MPGQLTAPSRRTAVWTVAGIVTAVLADVVLGLPGALLLAGAWALSYGYGRLDPRLRGPAAWAAGIVTEVSLVSALDFVLALASGHEHGPAPHLLILLAPVVVGLAARAYRAAEPPEQQRSSRVGLALTITVAGLLLQLWMSARGHGYDVAWALSGDGRNHVLLLRGIAARGGITLEQLRTYPALSNALSAVISSAGGRGGLAPGSLMLHDARAVSGVYVLSGIGLSTMFAGAVLECLPRSLATARRLPPAVLVVVLLCAVTSVSSFVLGTSLLDGFFSTYAALPMAVAAVILAIRCTDDASPYAVGLLGVATVYVLFAWTILAVVPFAASVATLAVLALPSARVPRTPAWLASGVVAAAGVLIVLGVLVTQYHKLRTQFLTPGPPPTPLQHWVLYLLTLVVVALLAGAANARAASRWAVILSAAVLGLVTVYWLREITPDGQTWTYYGAKSLWAISSALLWVGFVPVALAAGSQRVRTGAIALSAQTVQYVAAALAVVIVVGLLTKVADPVHKASHGWTQPSAAVITEVARQGNLRRPFVLWRWSDPGDDRLGDFAAELTWGSNQAGAPLSLPGYPQGFFQWGYEDNFQLHSLCLLARAVPELNIITKDPKLRGELADSCPANGSHVLLTPAA
jgi:hypothetical protein